jgi:hypothetical protein
MVDPLTFFRARVSLHATADRRGALADAQFSFDARSPADGCAVDTATS